MASRRRLLSEDIAEEIREVLERAVLEGMGRNAKSERYTMAGKTSTAYSPESSEHDQLGGE